MERLCGVKSPLTQTECFISYSMLYLKGRKFNKTCLNKYSCSETFILEWCRYKLCYICKLGFSAGLPTEKVLLFWFWFVCYNSLAFTIRSSLARFDNRADTCEKHLITIYCTWKAFHNNAFRLYNNHYIVDPLNWYFISLNTLTKLCMYFYKYTGVQKKRTRFWPLIAAWDFKMQAFTSNHSKKEEVLNVVVWCMA